MNANTVIFMMAMMMIGIVIIGAGMIAVMIKFNKIMDEHKIMRNALFKTRDKLSIIHDDYSYGFIDRYDFCKTTIGAIAGEIMDAAAYLERGNNDNQTEK